MLAHLRPVLPQSSTIRPTHLKPKPSSQIYGVEESSCVPFGMLTFFVGKQENSNREGFPAYVADRLSAVKWRNWKMHLILQEDMYDPPLRLPVPKIINLLTDVRAIYL